METILIRLDQVNGQAVATVDGCEERHRFAPYDALTFFELFMPWLALFEALAYERIPNAGS